MNKKYRVALTTEERARLEQIVRTGRAAAATRARARILLKADDAAGGRCWPDAAIAEALEVGVATVERTRKRFAAGGIEAATRRKPTTRASQRKLDGAQEARLAALACGVPPAGAERWTLALLADKLVELRAVESIARDTVRVALKKTRSSRGRSGSGRSRPVPMPPSWRRWRTSWIATPARATRTAPWSASTRAIRSSTARPPRRCPRHPASPPAARAPTSVTASATPSCSSRRWRTGGASRSRTGARRQIGRTACATGARRIVIVQDNLNTHSPAALYATFPPAEAKRIWDRLEFHYTPRQGSWLNMAEIELSVLSGQCLDRRIPDQATLRRQTDAWAARRNAARATIDWHFTTADARVKLTKLYPTLNPTD